MSARSRFVSMFVIVVVLFAWLSYNTSNVDVKASASNAVSYKHAHEMTMEKIDVLGTPMSYDTTCPDARYNRPVRVEGAPHPYRHFACGTPAVDVVDDIEAVEPIAIHDVVADDVVIEAPVDDVVTVIPEPVIVVDACAGGNPGNKKCNGNAGEDPNNKHTMPLDSGSLDGNGEHGNKGKGKG